MAEKIIASSDHAGVHLRQAAVQTARSLGFEVEDIGPAEGERADYPEQARLVAEAVAAGKARYGLVCCGTGIGVAIAANKVRGIRAAVCSTEFEARMARAHNDANVLCMGERVIGYGVADGIVRTFLSTSFEGGRHAVRVGMITALDEKR